MDYCDKVNEFMEVVTEYNKVKETKPLTNPDKGCIAVMSRIYLNKGMCSHEIAKELNLSRARLSSIVKKLKKKKYITTRFQINDKRKILIEITEEGSKVVKESYRKMKERLNNLFIKLGEEKTNLMISLLKDVLKIYSDEKEEIYA